MKYYRPIDLARKLKVSTSLIRQYEDKGLIPPAKRSNTSYRQYSNYHLQYLICVRKLQAGFGPTDIRNLMTAMINHDLTSALLLLNDRQHQLYQKIQYAQTTAAAFQDQETFIQVLKLSDKMNIKEAAQATGVAETTLRHWELEGLISPQRNAHNSYRIYNKEDIFKILIIKTIKSAIWSLTEIKQFLAEFRYDDFDHIQKMAEQSLDYLHQLNIYQHQGISALYQLAQYLNYVDEEYRANYTFNISI